MSKKSEIVKGANTLSLGISMVVAVLIGVGLGIMVKKQTNSLILFWICVAFGVMAAIANVYKIYKESLKSFENTENSAKNDDE